MSGRLIITPFNIELEAGRPVTQMADLITGFNLAPSQPLSILRQFGESWTLDQAFWSFTPAWMKQLHQAPYIIRSERLESSPMFKESWQQRRCLLPVTGYYIWAQLKRQKQPFAVRRPHNRPFFLAGLWTRYPVAPGRHYDSFGLISVAADPWLGKLTERLPLALDSQQLAAWLDPQTPLAQLRPLLTSDYPLECYPVSDLVKDPANQSSQVASPIAERRRPS
ncbi:SOS response-associated peptidase [Marinospirillum perlucidum]|uniref:SOS response-associated peptidase n=1 Tax=Marinospirillum perlucidum TaxID=1982602 RepID=UPI000DF149B2|nr:SOS response-associated peptidase [Marinospirillum perlucidum]